MKAIRRSWEEIQKLHKLLESCAPGNLEVTPENFADIRLLCNLLRISVYTDQNGTVRARLKAAGKQALAAHPGSSSIHEG